MLNNGNKKECGFIDEIVTYIYDEMPRAERSKFENHLAQCSVCTDEFAAVSDARFSVFEWQKEEFAPLPTPEINIPYERKTNITEEHGSAVFVGIRGFLSLVKMPIAAAAGIIIIFGLGFLISRSPNNNPSQATAPAIQGISEPTSTTVPVPKINKEKDTEVTSAITKSRTKEVLRVKANSRRASSGLKPMMARNLPKQNSAPAPVPPTAPVLNNFEAEDDNSLRLADLLADIDG